VRGTHRVGDLVVATVVSTEGADPRRGALRMTEQTATVGNWNLPNVLTGVRILLVPVFGFALLHEGR
jgi:hypothetical protein